MNPRIIPLFLLITACSTKPAMTEPAWPEQPSPSYPTLAENGAEDSVAGESLDQPDPAASVAPGSNLAKEYDGKKALETFEGQATYYADSLAGNNTANGDVYDPAAFTAAHKKLPFGTILRVVRQDTGAVTYVRVNDRGPFGSEERVIDLSKAAAQEIDMMRAGVVEVRVEVVDKP
jgi:rare lipoprotein A